MAVWRKSATSDSYSARPSPMITLTCRLTSRWLLVGLLTYLTLRRPGSDLDSGLGGGASGQLAVAQRSMRLVMPVVSAGFAVTVPLAVVLYLVTSSAWTYGQQLLLFR
jgi:membrane protein insertase Oxa1/YidC/SpoIIIJ